MTCFVTIKHDERVLGWAKSAERSTRRGNLGVHFGQFTFFLSLKMPLTVLKDPKKRIKSTKAELNGSMAKFWSALALFPLRALNS